MCENITIANDINVLGKFCGTRDISALTPDSLIQKTGKEKCDVMVLFEGSIMAGGDLLAQGIKNHIAEKYIIVGGESHTT